MTKEIKTTNNKQVENNENSANLWVACYIKSQSMKVRNK